MKQLLLWLGVAFYATGMAQQKGLVGTRAPNVKFEHLINTAQHAYGLQQLKGKEVVLDFWATWCAPCIKSFPPLEELQQKYKGQVQVLAITYEKEERIKTFLSKRKLVLPVALDASGSIAAAFPHRAIQHAVVIDKQGIIQAITTSDQVYSELIAQVLAGKQVELAEKKDDLEFDPSKLLSGDSVADYQVIITPFKAGYPSLSDPLGEGDYMGRRVLAVNV
ncbi:MAG TPA: TlpA disulfide reductase family protein [Phnomibacter sp.]|nr:TlpA disulfide reductase family protein [Phnomibacter sp.]